MNQFWHSAVGAAGLGAIACFVFWSLYKGWFKLPLFQTLTQDQLYKLFRLFFILTFLFAVAALTVYALGRQRPTNEAVSILASRFAMSKQIIGQTRDKLVAERQSNPAAKKEIDARLHDLDEFAANLDKAWSEELEAVKANEIMREHEAAKHLFLILNSVIAKRAISDIDLRDMVQELSNKRQLTSPSQKDEPPLF